MFGTQKQNSFNPDLKMVHSKIYQKRKELTYFPTTMWREMLGIIASMLLMTPKDLSNSLEIKRLLPNNSTFSSKEVHIGLLFGFLIPTIGQETSTIFFLCGSSLLLTDLISLKNTPE